MIGALIAINMGLGLYAAGLKPGAIISFMAVSYMFCLFLHSFRRQD